MCDEFFFAPEANEDAHVAAMTADSAPVPALRRVRMRYRRIAVRAPRPVRRAPDRAFYAPIALTREG